VPFCNEIGIQVPSHYDEQQATWMVDRAFPAAFDAEAKRWEDEEISWDEVLVRWKARGPMNETFVGLLQEGHKELSRLIGKAA
jgi:ring-1,2-phenylacetyl-CoA epoxidase subunit PaaA